VSRTSSTSPAAAEPLALAGALVDWANAQGGKDNISVALARIDPG
jgi:serine/threonine protein phosphatase PrpC